MLLVSGDWNGRLPAYQLSQALSSPLLVGFHLYPCDSQVRSSFTKVDRVTSPSFCSCRYQYILHLTRAVVGSCTCNRIGRIETLVGLSRGLKGTIPEAIRCPRVLISIGVSDGHDVEVLSSGSVVSHDHQRGWQYVVVKEAAQRVVFRRLCDEPVSDIQSCRDRDPLGRDDISTRTRTHILAATVPLWHAGRP